MQKTILLIEDNTEILDNLSEFLELKGYTTLLAKSGKMGIEFAERFIPDLIICDVLMHGMDGHEVLLHLLSCSKTNKIPFVFSTSLCESCDKRDALLLGADDYLVKPFQLDILLETTKKWLKLGTRRVICSATSDAIPIFFRPNIKDVSSGQSRLLLKSQL
jgi:DNA-binding response OmpR family regulator